MFDWSAHNNSTTHEIVNQIFTRSAQFGDRTVWASIMRVEAVLEQHGVAADDRATARRSLKLAVRAQSSAAGERPVVIQNLSRTGLLVEAAEGTLAVGDALFVDVPEDGAVESKVVWESGRFFGCKFRAPISQAAVSGALLQAEPRSTPGLSPDPGAVAGRSPGGKLVPEVNFSVALLLAVALWGALLVAGYLLFR